MTLPRSTDPVAAHFPGVSAVAATACGLFAVLLAAGCGKRENHTLGVDLIEDQAAEKAVRTTTLAAPDTSADFQLAGPEGTAGQSPEILLGRFDGLFSRAAVRFDLSALPDSGQSASLTSATARFFFDEGSGDPQSLMVTVHRVLASWTETIASADSAFPAIDPTGVPASFAVSAAGDSAEVSLTDLVKFWIDHPDSSFGFALVPDPSANALLEFASGEGLRPPQLLAAWTTAGGDSNAAIPPVDDTYSLGTTTGFVPLSDEPRRLAVGRGIPARSLLKCSIPDFGPRATIHRAELTLFTDLSRSRLTDVTLGVQRVLAEPWNAGFTSVNTAFDGTVTAEASSDSLTLVVSATVASMVENGNHGFLVRAAVEATDAEYVRFHAHDTEDPARRPRLKIWYTPGDDPEEAP